MHLDGDGLDEGEAVATRHHLSGARLERAHVDLVRVRMRARGRVEGGARVDLRLDPPGEIQGDLGRNGEIWGDLRRDSAGHGGVVEDAHAVEEELVAREGADVRVVERLREG